MFGSDLRLYRRDAERGLDVDRLVTDGFAINDYVSACELCGRRHREKLALVA